MCNCNLQRTRILGVVMTCIYNTTIIIRDTRHHNACEYTESYIQIIFSICMPEECSCIFSIPPPAVPTASSPQCDLSIWLYIGNRLAVGGGDKEKKRMVFYSGYCKNDSYKMMASTTKNCQ